MAAKHDVIHENIRLLEEGRELLGRIPGEAYSLVLVRERARGIGPHLRHILEHYSCFLAGLDEGRVDYESRPREAALEVEVQAAVARIRELVEGLGRVDEAGFGRSLEVRLDCGDEASDQWSRSTVKRELQFLLSHTVHHYALIGQLLLAQGIDAGPEFGVAPSTLRHWQQAATCAPLPG
ncbi:MAG: hypothetical protein U0X73_01740 [Thermoanaerobaculia bacterium]